MLNSEQLEQLKILQVNEKKQPFAKIGSIIASSSNIKLMSYDPNANIRSFYCILLCHIFGTHFAADPTTTDKNQAVSDAQYKLYRIKHLLYSQDIRLNQIRNIPQSLERVLSQQFVSNKKPFEESQFINQMEKSQYKNLYMKKLITQLLTLLWRECSKISSHSSHQEGSAKIQMQRNQQIFKFIKQFPVADCLLCIFIRELLYKEYDIHLACDYGEKIPDHTVYTALCDAFGYNGLKLDDNECYISNDSIIYAYDIQGSSSPLTDKCYERYYIVSLLSPSPSSHNTSENIEFETFRNRRKASRDLKLEGNQLSIGDNSFAKKESAGIPSSSSSLSIKQRRDVRFFSQSVDGEFWVPEKMQKQMSKQYECEYLQDYQEKDKIPAWDRSGKYKNLQIQTKQTKQDSGEYTSIDVIMQLSPKIRQMMLKTHKNLNLQHRQSR